MSQSPGSSPEQDLVSSARSRVAEEEAYLDKAISRYSPEVAAAARAGLKKLRARFPGARQMVFELREQTRHRGTRFSVYACRSRAVKRIPLLVIAAVMALARAQSPAFEVASVRPFQGLPLNVEMNVSGPRVTISEYGLRGLLMTAYQVESWQISGGPVWLDTDRFNIVANAPGEGSPTGEQVRQMLQTLLAERFQLKVHREKKERPVYALVVDKHGPKLKPGTSADSSFTAGGRARTVQLTFQKRTMEFFALQLSTSGGLGREVVDKTGLTGNYDFKLEWAAGNDGNPPPDSNEPGLFTAVQEQLGLKLEAQRAPVQTLVIDHAEKPSPN